MSADAAVSANDRPAFRFFSERSFDDLAHDFFLVKKSFIPFFICVRKIRRKVGIDDNTHQISDLYQFGLPILDDQYVFMPSVWKLFDSYDAPELPHKDFERWDSVNAEG